VDELIAMFEYAKGRPWMTGREPRRDDDHDVGSDLSCVRLTQADVDLVLAALRAYSPGA